MFAARQQGPTYISIGYIDSIHADISDFIHPAKGGCLHSLNQALEKAAKLDINTNIDFIMPWLHGVHHPAAVSALHLLLRALGTNNTAIVKAIQGQYDDVSLQIDMRFSIAQPMQNLSG